MEELAPIEVLNQVRAEFVRIYGEKYARLCLLEYARGWYYVSEPTVVEDGKLKGNPLARPMQRRKMLGLLDKLRKIE